jgi:hypothetical protein
MRSNRYIYGNMVVTYIYRESDGMAAGRLALVKRPYAPTH